MVIAAEKFRRIADGGGALRVGRALLSSAAPLNSDRGSRINEKEYPYDLFIGHCSLAIERGTCQGMTIDSVAGLY